MPGSLKIINLKCTVLFQLLYLKIPFHSVPLAKIVYYTVKCFHVPVSSSLFTFGYKQPHLSLSPQRGPGHPMGSQNGTPWVYSQIKHFKRLYLPSVPLSKTTQNMDECPNKTSMLHREKLTVFCVICSLSPSNIPQNPHTRELHSTATSKQKRTPSQCLGTLSQLINLNANFPPNPDWPRSIFK